MNLEPVTAETPEFEPNDLEQIIWFFLWLKNVRDQAVARADGVEPIK